MVSCMGSLVDYNQDNARLAQQLAGRQGGISAETAGDFENKFQADIALSNLYSERRGAFTEMADNKHC